MKNNTVRSLLCLVLLAAVLLVAAWGVNALTAPIVEAHEKAKLGDAVVIYKAGEDSELTVSGQTVKTVLRDESKQLYTISLSTTEGYTGEPIELTLTVGFDGKIADLKIDSTSETKELSEDFLPSFAGKDSALEGVELVAGVTYSSSAIRRAVAEGMDALAENGLITAGEKSPRQLLTELAASVYPDLVNEGGSLLGEEVAGSGHITDGRMAPNAAGFLWFLNDGSADYLGVWTPDGGAELYGTDGSEADDAALLEEIDALSKGIVKEIMGDSVLIYDAADPAASELTAVGESVQKIYRDGGKEQFMLLLSTDKGYTGNPIELTLTVGFDGKIIALKLDSSAETKELSDDFLPSFAGQDSTLSGVDLVAGVTFSSSAIKNAAAEGMDALAENGLIEGAEKSVEQLMDELLPKAFPGLVNKAGSIVGEELAGSGRVTNGWAAGNGSGFAWFVKDGDDDYLGVWTVVGGAKLYTPKGAEVDDTALLDEINALSEANLDRLAETKTRTLTRMLPDDSELVLLSIPGAKGCVTAAFTVETADGMLYAFVAKPYGYGDQPLELYYVLNAEGEIVAFRAKELILESEYYTPKELDEDAYKEGFIGMSADSYGEPVMVTGATVTCNAVDQALNDVFEAFRLATEG